MPVQNVADIVGRRNLVEEAQGWVNIGMKKKELEMQRQKAEKENKPKPYQFEFADWGSQNQYMQEWMGDLQDKSVALTMADSQLLRIAYYDENCGAECQMAHKRLRNRHHAAKTMQNLQTQFKTDYEKLKDLIENPQTSGDYDNAENRAKLRRMREEWVNGMKLDIDSDGRLIVLQGEDIQIDKVDDNGNPLYMTADNKETSDPESAATDENGEKIRAKTVDPENKNWVGTTIDDYYSTLDLGRVDRNATKWDPSIFENLVEYENYDPEGGPDGLGFYDVDPNSQVWQEMEIFLFGRDGLTQSGYSIMNSETKPIIQAIRDSKNDQSYQPTRDEIIQFAFNAGGRYKHGAHKEDVLKSLEKKQTEEPATLDDMLSTYQGNIEGINYYELNEDPNADEGSGSYILSDQGQKFNSKASVTIESSGDVEEAEILFDTDGGITLLNGNNRIQGLDANQKTIIGVGQTVKFDYSKLEVLPRYKDGQFITEEQLEQLIKEKDDKWLKENITWDIGVRGKIRSDDENTRTSWANNGIGNTGGESASVIVPLSSVREDVMDAGPEKSKNPMYVEHFEELKNRLNEEGFKGTASPSSKKILSWVEWKAQNPNGTTDEYVDYTNKNK